MTNAKQMNFSLRFWHMSPRKAIRSLKLEEYEIENQLDKSLLAVERNDGLGFKCFFNYSGFVNEHSEISYLKHVTNDEKE